MAQYTETAKPWEFSQQIISNLPLNQLLALKLQDFDHYFLAQSALCFEPLQSCFLDFVLFLSKHEGCLLTDFVPPHDSGTPDGSPMLCGE